MIYHLTCGVAVTAYTTVEAESLQQAKEIAESRSVHLSFNGCGLKASRCWLVESADGEPQDIQEV
jgi:hypothetical protein